MNRRKLLGSLAVVGGVSAMPSNWVKPVINSVILPAHAQTSEIDADSSQSPLIPGLTLVDTTFDIQDIAVIGSFTFNSQILPDNVLTSGGYIVLVIENDAAGTPDVNLTFADSDNLSVFGTFDLTPGAPSIPSGQLTDSSGQDFVLNFSINTAGDTLNVSLDLV